MTNHVYHYISEAAGHVRASYEADVGTVEATVRLGNPAEHLLKGVLWHEAEFQNRRAALSNKSFEQNNALWTGQGRSKRVLMFFCAKPDDKPVEIDLACYIRVGLSKRPSPFPRDFRAGTCPIRLVGERFHDLPALSLCDAWLRWRDARFSSQA